MDITTLKKEELLKIRGQIDSQLKHIDSLKKEVKKLKEKTILSDLNPNDKIFCINFYGSKIYNMDFVEIDFHKKDTKDYIGWTNVSTHHNTKPMGFSASIEDVCMNNHFFLLELVSSMYFLTLKPENWRVDLNSELTRIIKSKEEYFNECIESFKRTVKDITKSDEVDEFIKQLA